mgnify:CR=1 FL=1
MGAIAAQAEQAVQLCVLVGLFHGRDLIDLVILDHAHQFEGGALGAQNGAAQCQDAAEVVLAHLPVLAVDQAVVAVQDAHDLHIITHPGIQCLCYAANGCVQARAVAAGGQDANTFFISQIPRFLLIFPAAEQGMSGTIRVFPKGKCVKKKFCKKKKETHRSMSLFRSEQRDLNPRPPRPERGALPTALCPENTAAGRRLRFSGWG